MKTAILSILAIFFFASASYASALWPYPYREKGIERNDSVTKARENRERMHEREQRVEYPRPRRHNDIAKARENRKMSRERRLSRGY